MNILTKFTPSEKKNRMETKTDLVSAREYFLTGKNRVLFHLVKSRYEWMNSYISANANCVIELGCGTGIGQQFLHTSALIQTDIIEMAWIDKRLDALQLDMPDASVDAFIVVNAIHHFAYPLTFLKNAARKLRAGGVMLFFEPYTSICLKIPQRILGLEGWDDGSNVFDESIPCNEEGKPWSANNSIPKLLFSDRQRFEMAVPELKVEKYELTECLLFLLSGGVNYKTLYLPLNDAGCKRLIQFDCYLIKHWPKTFAMGCRVVLRKDK